MPETVHIANRSPAHTERICGVPKPSLGPAIAVIPRGLEYYYVSSSGSAHIRSLQAARDFRALVSRRRKEKLPKRRYRTRPMPGFLRRLLVWRDDGRLRMPGPASIYMATGIALQFFLMKSSWLDIWPTICWM
jgi:hypothetical protein